MASKNGRSGAKTKRQQPSRKPLGHERRPKKAAGLFARTEGQKARPGKAVAGLADKGALAQELVTSGDRAELFQAQAYQTFLKELPELLEKHSGQWVAYRGKTQVGLGAGKTILLQKCLRRGLDPKELMVRRIRPGGDESPTLFEQGMI